MQSVLCLSKLNNFLSSNPRFLFLLYLDAIEWPKGLKDLNTRAKQKFFEAALIATSDSGKGIGAPSRLPKMFLGISMWKATAHGRGCRCVVAVDLKWQLHLFSFFYEFCTSNISMVRISFSLFRWWSPFLHQFFILRDVAIFFSKSLNFRGAIQFFYL